MAAKLVSKNDCGLCFCAKPIYHCSTSTLWKSCVCVCVSVGTKAPKTSAPKTLHCSKCSTLRWDTSECLCCNVGAHCMWEMEQNEQQGKKLSHTTGINIKLDHITKDQISVAHTHTRQRLLHSKWSTPYEYYTPLSVKSFLSVWHCWQAAPQLSDCCWRVRERVWRHRE